MTDDAQLLDQARQFEPAALQALHQQFYEPVARYIYFKAGGDSRLTEDLSGEVFVRVLEGLRRGGGWRESPRGWILGIARNVVADHYRQQERQPEVALSEDLLSSEETDPTIQADQNEQRRLIMRAIDRLTEEQRDVILMRFIKGIDVQDIAKALGKKPGAIKGLQHRALRVLAMRLQGLQQDDTS